MPTPKNHRGNAYITVLISTMLIIMLATIALSVTAVSRRLTARYSDYIGLYDLAVAGNEQALFLLLQTLNTERESITNHAWQQLQTWEQLTLTYQDGNLHLDPPSQNEFRRIFIQEAMTTIRAGMGINFSRHLFMYQLIWGLDATINTYDRNILDSYRAVTTICAAATHFHLDTVIHRQIETEPSINTIVEATINWTSAGQREITLDAYTINNLAPNLPNNEQNMILFLDEFTLEMVESLRLQIGIHTRRREEWAC